MKKTDVFGVSSINHKNRLKFELTNDQYIVLDFIQYWKTNQSKRATALDIHKRIGMSLKDFKAIKDELVVIGLLIPNKSKVEVSPKWADMYDFNKDFEEFWVIFQKKGNKGKARENYKKCRVMVDKETLHKAAESKVKSQDDMKYLPHAATWLNPTYKHWEDEVEVKQKKPAVGGNFLKTSV